MIRAICTSPQRGTEKQPLDSAWLKVGWGIEGDAHGGNWHRQVSLIGAEAVDAFNERGAAVKPGSFGENLVVSGINFRALPMGTRLSIGEALLELTQQGKECHSHCQIYHRMGDCIMPREGVFARVLAGGKIAVEDTVLVLPGEDLPRATVITASDRSSRGERTDESGPLAAKLLRGAGYAVEAELLLPDDKAALETALIDLCDRRHMRLIITTGGTGFAPRDVTPEATAAVIERSAPGIAEAIRAHSMTKTPRAMLSRGIAGIRGQTLIVNLPGSPKAVEECLRFVLPHLGHGLELLTGKGDN